MKNPRIFICCSGITSPLGTGLDETAQALWKNSSRIQPLDLFTVQQQPLPVGQAPLTESSAHLLPRTHRLAEATAEQAMKGFGGTLDAVVIGTTTGGMLRTEELLREQCADPVCYRYHGLGTVAEHLAHKWNCTGPALTVSTACSSGAVALTLAINLLRSGNARTILVGGVDSLCRLTYYGFHSLQLVDRKGSRPLDQERNGMAVAEGAGMLLLSTREPEETACAELLGGGLSCDAYHPAAPHPEGQGAYAAMKQALQDAGLQTDQIGYINLHGTGTPDNDLAESRAVRRLFPTPPPLSSIKGATGHSLAAAGAIEAVLGVIAIDRHLLPANTNLEQVDPELELQPVTIPRQKEIQAVLSNSFGFGGNNGSLVICKPHTFPTSSAPAPDQAPVLGIHSYSCITGAGLKADSLKKLWEGRSAAGMVALKCISSQLPQRMIRRLKRLPQMTLALAQEAMDEAAATLKPECIFMGTGWGALSETHDFLDRLAKTQEQFPSPTDFIGSVHNGPAGQAAIMLGATGANITSSGGDYSFEQSLVTALNMLTGNTTALLMGADEGHAVFSPLLDPSTIHDSSLSDGGAAFTVSPDTKGAICTLSLPYFKTCVPDTWIEELSAALLPDRLGCEPPWDLVLAGIPAATEEKGELQLQQFMKQTHPAVPVIRYRQLVGQFASASAVATALGVYLLEQGTAPASLTEKKAVSLGAAKSRILILGLGDQITAMELARP